MNVVPDTLIKTVRRNGNVGNQNINLPIIEMADYAELYGKKIVEVGCHIGVLTEIFANIGSEVYAVDTWRDDHLKCRIKNRGEKWDERLRSYKNVTKIIGDSVRVRSSVKDKSVDFVYIDANHRFRHVSSDIIAWLPKVVDGGWIGGHDYNNTFKAVVDAVDIIRSYVPNTCFKAFKDSSWIMKVSV